MKVITWKLFTRALILTVVSGCLTAHPMGNFSINHYTKINLAPAGPELTYILDFAEIPTSTLFSEWGTDATAGAALQRSAARQADTWAKSVTLTINGKPVAVRWSNSEASTLDGAGGMPVLRVVMVAKLSAPANGELEFKDNNFPNRTGWKEVVIAHAASVVTESASQSDRDLSKALTVYPTDLTQVPPQDLAASVSWHVNGTTPLPATLKTPAVPKPVVVTSASVSLPAAPVPPSFSSSQPAAAGTVERGDYLSRMLRQKHFGFSAILIGLLAAFGLGAMHALSPGHGKTIVAAYLVGSRGTLKHAGILGLTVTFTHTISVFALGIGVLFFQRYVIPERIVPVLGAISGLSIVAIGGYLLYKRTMALARTPQIQTQDHGHAHAHAHAHSHSHSHEAKRKHSHSHHSDSNEFAHTHTHDGLTHTHVVPESITMGSLLGLGISGGLVPCPSALILLLSAISLGQVAIGLALLGSFSAGLAVVLMAVGGIVVYGKGLLPKSSKVTSHPAMRLLPVFSSVVVIVLGLLMTLTAAGFIQPIRLLS